MTDIKKIIDNIGKDVDHKEIIEICYKHILNLVDHAGFYDKTHKTTKHIIDNALEIINAFLKTEKNPDKKSIIIALNKLAQIEGYNEEYDYDWELGPIIDTLNAILIPAITKSCIGSIYDHALTATWKIYSPGYNKEAREKILTDFIKSLESLS